jgi:hypothetical protein
MEGKLEFGDNTKVGSPTSNREKELAYQILCKTARTGVDVDGVTECSLHLGSHPCSLAEFDHQRSQLLRRVNYR